MSFWDMFLFDGVGHVEKSRVNNARPMPASLADLSPDDRLFVTEYLKPLLSSAEWERLEKAQGEWPRFPRVLVELADRHPVALPGPRGPTRVAELPEEVQSRLAPRGKPGKFPFRKFEGKWPDFAVKITEVVRPRTQPLPRELWPTDFADLSPAVREFVHRKLKPALDPTEAELLAAAEGRWPNYPVTIQKLADRHYLSVPWQVLPGPPARWEPYRPRPAGAADGLPRVPKQALRDFALVYLSADDLERLQLAPGDPATWQRLTRAYFERKPAELRRLREIDRRAQGAAPKGRKE
jgi:hypothetical protein